MTACARWDMEAVVPKECPEHRMVVKGEKKFALTRCGGNFPMVDFYAAGEGFVLDAEGKQVPIPEVKPVQGHGGIIPAHASAAQ